MGVVGVRLSQKQVADCSIQERLEREKRKNTRGTKTKIRSAFILI